MWDAVDVSVGADLTHSAHTHIRTHTNPHPIPPTPIFEQLRSFLYFLMCMKRAKYRIFLLVNEYPAFFVFVLDKNQ